MLDHLAKTRSDEHCRTTARKIEAAYERAVVEGMKTRDLDGRLDTIEFADAVIERLA